jgi:hypothetical protein
MHRLLAILVLSMTCGTRALAADPTGPMDPLLLDPGEGKDEAGFMAWVKDPRTAPMHPLAKLELIVQKDPRNRKDYLAFLDRQAGVTGPAAAALNALAETIYVRGPLTTSPPATRDLQHKDKMLAEKLAKQGREFFRLVPREARVRVYKVAEKFELTRLAMLDLVRTSQTGITDAWIEQERADEDRREAGYFFGLCKDRDAATVRAVLEDFKMTVTFMMTFAGPPGYVHGDKARNKVRAEKRAQRAALIKALDPITF